MFENGIDFSSIFQFFEVTFNTIYQWAQDALYVFTEDISSLVDKLPEWLEVFLRGTDIFGLISNVSILEFVLSSFGVFIGISMIKWVLDIIT